MYQNQHTINPRTPEERFWSKVDPCRTDGCALWLGALQPSGYGVFDKKSAHSFLVGRAPDGLQWDHVRERGCLHKNCVWPDHLEAVTCRVNILRSDGPAAKNAVKTHCPQGHAYDLLNTSFSTKGHRYCRECRRESTRRLRAIKRGVQP